MKKKPTPKSQLDISKGIPSPYNGNNPNTEDNRANHTSFKNDNTKAINIGLQDIDESILYYFENVIRPTISQNDEAIKVPIIYGSPEKWKSYQKDGYLRDASGKIMAPLILFKMESIEKDRSRGNKLDANNPHNFVIFKKPYSARDAYSNFNILTNRVPEKTYYSTVIPEYINVRYRCVITANYAYQLNKIIEDIQYASDSYWGNKEKYQFNARIDSFDLVTEVSVGEERVIKSTFDIKLNGYIIPDNIQKNLTQAVKKFSDKSRIIFSVETEIPKGEINVKDDKHLVKYINASSSCRPVHVRINDITIGYPPQGSTFNIPVLQSGSQIGSWNGTQWIIPTCSINSGSGGDVLLLINAQTIDTIGSGLTASVEIFNSGGVPVGSYQGLDGDYQYLIGNSNVIINTTFSQSILAEDNFNFQVLQSGNQVGSWDGTNWVIPNCDPLTVTLGGVEIVNQENPCGVDVSLACSTTIDAVWVEVAVEFQKVGLYKASAIVNGRLSYENAPNHVIEWTGTQYQLRDLFVGPDWITTNSPSTPWGGTWINVSDGTPIDGSLTQGTIGNICQTPCNPLNYEIYNTEATLLISGSQVDPCGVLIQLMIQDASVRLRDTINNLLSTTAIPASKIVDIIAPNGSLQLQNSSGSNIGSPIIIRSNQTGSASVGDSDIIFNSTLIKSILAESSFNFKVRNSRLASIGTWDGVSIINIDDSPLIVNGSEVTNIAATDSFTLKVLQSGSEIGSWDGNNWIIPPCDPLSISINDIKFDNILNPCSLGSYNISIVNYESQSVGENLSDGVWTVPSYKSLCTQIAESDTASISTCIISNGKRPGVLSVLIPTVDLSDFITQIVNPMTVDQFALLNVNIQTTDGLTLIATASATGSFNLPKSEIKILDASGGENFLAESNTEYNGTHLIPFLTVPRITIYESDGVTVQGYAGVDNPFYTVNATTSGSDIVYNFGRILHSGQTTSYRSGDEGTMYANGFFDYTRPVYPLNFAELGVNFVTLAANNIHGNTIRFTDRAGSAAATSGNRFIQDHLTMLEWYVLGTLPTAANWNNCIDAGVAINATLGETGWTIPSEKILDTITDDSLASALNYAPFNINTSLWTSTTRGDDTTFARRYVNPGSAFGNSAKTATFTWIYVRRMP